MIFLATHLVRVQLGCLLQKLASVNLLSLTICFQWEAMIFKV